MNVSRGRLVWGGVALVATLACVQCASERGAAPATTPPPSSGPPAHVATPVSTEDQRSLPLAGLGTNLTGLVDWTTEEPFVDAFKMARRMGAGTADVWAVERELVVDEHGWVRRLRPSELARTLVFTDTGTFRPGRYVVRSRGNGVVRFGGAARELADASRPGRTVLDVRPPRPGDTGIAIDLLETDPNDPWRDVHIYPPGGACAEDRARFCDEQHPCATGACLSFEEHAESLVFHPDFLAKLRPYGMLRFMDLMDTNGSAIRRWDERPRVDDATWTHRGVPLEVLIRLANQTRSQPWFCIPHEADDDYVRSFAEQVAREMDPTIPVWVEYSNEIWNGLFPQHRYAVERGESLGLGEGFQAALRFQARRSGEIFDIVEEVLGRARLVRVIAAQGSNPWVAETLLSDPSAARFDALAIAPYFGLIPNAQTHSSVAAMSVDELFRHTRTVLLPEVRAWTRAHAELALQHRLRLVAYEAGQHFVGVEGAEDDARINALFDAVNRDPRMKDVYLEYLEGWRADGGGWLNHFVNVSPVTKWGRWGALEHVRQPRERSPKYDALLTFAETHPEGW